MQPATDIVDWINVEPRSRVRVWLFAGTANAGFPSPADDYLDRPLDFNELLIHNAAATFVIRIAGDSMIGVGIFPDDLAVVNRAKEPLDGCVVLALVDGSFTVKTFRRRAGRIWLQPENSAYQAIEITEGMAFEVWGVVTNAIRML